MRQEWSFASRAPLDYLLLIYCADSHTRFPRGGDCWDTGHKREDETYTMPVFSNPRLFSKLNFPLRLTKTRRIGVPYQIVVRSPESDDYYDTVAQNVLTILTKLRLLYWNLDAAEARHQDRPADLLRRLPVPEK